MSKLDILINHIFYAIVILIIYALVKIIWRIEKNSGQKNQLMLNLILLLYSLSVLFAPMIFSLIFGFQMINWIIMITYLVISMGLGVLSTLRLTKLADMIFPSSFISECILFSDTSRKNGLVFTRFMQVFGFSLQTLVIITEIIVVILN